MHLWSRRRALAATVCCIAAVFAFVSCSDDDTVAPPPPGPNIKIDIDSTLTVSWDPTLQVNKLYVEWFDGPNIELVWFIADKNGFTSPVTYGQVPAGAQALRPAMRFDPKAAYRVTLISSDADGDRPVATASVGVPATAVSTYGGESVVYAPGVQRLTPPGVAPEIWEFMGLAIVPNAAWKDLPDDGEVEALLDVRLVIMRALDRDDDGYQVLRQYEDLRAADAPAGGGTTSIIWDQIRP